MSSHPRLPGDLWRPGDELHDTAERWSVERSESRYDDGFVTVRTDTVQAPDGATFARSIVEHPGAVGVLAMDEDGRVLLLRQYRHAAGARLLELPAGICDVADELPEQTAARELHEEASLTSADWRLLVDVAPTPGSSTERWRIFFARDLEAVADADRHQPVHEEADMTAVWVPLDEVVMATLDGRLTDGMAGLAALAAQQVRNGIGLDSLPGMAGELPP